MAKHNLALEVLDSLHPCVLPIKDISAYSPVLAVDCPKLHIKVPGFNNSVAFNVAAGFDMVFTACDLQIQFQECGTQFYDLPDGIYAIKYSVSPNEYVYVEYNHLRMVKALTMYYEALCDLDLGECEPSASQSQKLKRLQTLKGYLDAAKASVEICHEPQKGMVLYNYALSQLKKFNCKSCH